MDMEEMRLQKERDEALRAYNEADRKYREYIYRESIEQFMALVSREMFNEAKNFQFLRSVDYVTKEYYAKFIVAHMGDLIASAKALQEMDPECEMTGHEVGN